MDLCRKISKLFQYVVITLLSQNIGNAYHYSNFTASYMMFESNNNIVTMKYLIIRDHVELQA